MRGEPFGEKRRVVIAQARTEPGEALNRTQRFDSERQDEQNLSIGLSTNHNGGNKLLQRADVALPVGKPIDGLKHRVVGVLLERSPFPADLIEVVMDAEVDVRLSFRLRNSIGQPHRLCWLIPRCERLPQAVVNAGCGGSAATTTLATPESDIANRHRLLARKPDQPPAYVCNHS